MFQALLALVAFGLSLTAVADETVKVFPPGSAQDVLQKSDRDPTNPVGKEGGAVIVKKDCRTSAGKRIDRGQPGYERCLEERMQKAQKPANGATRSE